VSQQKVEIVRQLIGAFNRHEEDAILELVDSEIEFHSALVEGQTYRGYAGVQQYLQDLDEVWSEWHTEDDRFLAAGEEQILHLYRIVGLGRGSGVPVQHDFAILWTLRGGKIQRGEAFLSQVEALRAAGLSE
jgi:ketosteroid isomerase-like protein